MALVGFPLLLIPLAIINIFVFLMPGVSFTDPLVSVPLMSGAVWHVTFSDALLALAILLLLFEVIKAARPQGRYLTDHLLSLLAFAAVVAEFLLLPGFANSMVFLLAVMMAVEFLAGVSLRLRRGPARRAAARQPEVVPTSDSGFEPASHGGSAPPPVASAPPTDSVIPMPAPSHDPVPPSHLDDAVR
jgi:hypothetical protein